jgi:hypothetical protein
MVNDRMRRYVRSPQDDNVPARQSRRHGRLEGGVRAGRRDGWYYSCIEEGEASQTHEFERNETKLPGWNKAAREAANVSFDNAGILYSRGLKGRSGGDGIGD